jgi:hypothetical protein
LTGRKRGNSCGAGMMIERAPFSLAALDLGCVVNVLFEIFMICSAKAISVFLSCSL